MERTQLFDLMGELKLYGMKAAFDEIMATAVKRQHEPQRIVGDLLNAEINEKQARSIKYQLTIAKLPLAKDLDDFQFDGTPINETLVRDLAGGGFIAQQRNAVLVGGTGTGKTHLPLPLPEAASDPAPVAGILQRGRSRKPARDRDPQRKARLGRRSAYSTGLYHTRRTRLSADRSIRRAAPIPSRQPPLRADLTHRHHQPCIRRMAERLQ